MRYPAMTVLAAAAAAAVTALSAPARAADPAAASLAPAASPPAAVAAAAAPADDPYRLSLAPGGAARPARAVRPVYLQAGAPESIYPELMPPTEAEGVNAGGVNFTLTVNYLTDYVFRGIDRSEDGGAEDAPNLQFDGAMSFNLGKLPHPVVGLFVNVYNDDPISRFQEIRPFVGLDWNIKPLTISAGQISYIFPEREDQNTAEVYFKLELDDSGLFGTDRPVFGPYAFAAYDYDRYEGLYIEAGLRHDFLIEDTGIIVTAVANVAYVVDHPLFARTELGEDTGFQHYDVGLIGAYSLNTLLNVPRRFGEFKLKGYLFYTDGIDNELESDSQLWGGVGITFEY